MLRHGPEGDDVPMSCMCASRCPPEHEQQCAGRTCRAAGLTLHSCHAAGIMLHMPCASCCWPHAAGCSNVCTLLTLHCCMNRKTGQRSIAWTHLVAHDDGCQAMVSNVNVAQIALGFDGLPLPGLGALHDRPRKEVQAFLDRPALEVATQKQGRRGGLRGSRAHTAASMVAPKIADVGCHAEEYRRVVSIPLQYTDCG